SNDTLRVVKYLPWRISVADFWKTDMAICEGWGCHMSDDVLLSTIDNIGYETVQKSFTFCLMQSLYSVEGLPCLITSVESVMQLMGT
ncbi:hypothetical protein L195_g031550, partial [Trifolium pratense]